MESFPFQYAMVINSLEVVKYLEVLYFIIVHLAITIRHTLHAASNCVKIFS